MHAPFSRERITQNKIPTTLRVEETLSRISGLVVYRLPGKYLWKNGERSTAEYFDSTPRIHNVVDSVVLDVKTLLSNSAG